MKKTFTAFAASAIVALPLMAAPANYAPLMKVDASQIDDEVIYDQPDGTLSWLDRSCDGFVTQAYEATHGRILGSVVQMVEGEDGHVYLSHMASEYPVNTWTRFEREGDTLVMNGIQAIYTEYDEWYDEELTVYLAPMKVVVNENNVGTFVVPEDCRYVFNIGEDGSLTAADPEMLLGVCVYTLDNTLEGNDVWIWKGFGDRDIKMMPASGVPVSLPEGLATQEWVMNDGFNDSFVSVAVDGDDFYLNGVDWALPESWVKGTIADGKVTFPSGQYLGVDMNVYYYSYFCGADFSTKTDADGEEIKVASLADCAVFAYDAEKGQLTQERGYVINSTKDQLFPLYFYDDVRIGAQNRDPEAAPAAPYDLEFYNDDWGQSLWFQLPNTDVNGDLLNVNRLYYEIYVNGQLQSFDIADEDGNMVNTSLIPYMYDDWIDFWVFDEDPKDHTVYLYCYDLDVQSVGVRSVYVNENGDDVYSEMAYWGLSNGVSEVERTPVSVKYYDLQGRQVSSDQPGVAIKITSFGNGKEVREKVMVK